LKHNIHGKDKTVESVCNFEQQSRDKLVISCCAQSASKLQVMSPVTQSWHQSCPWVGLGWVGLGQLAGGLGWIGSHKMDPWTTLVGRVSAMIGQQQRLQNTTKQLVIGVFDQLDGLQVKRCNIGVSSYTR